MGDWTSRGGMKYFWYFLDWFDDRIIGHRFYWLCKFIGLNYPEEKK